MIATLAHPGPAPMKRWAIQPCAVEPVDLVLPVADTLAASVAQAMAGFDGGWLEIGPAAMARLAFVIPGTDPTGAHAAWYADPHAPGPGHIERLGLHFGRKEGAPFLHGHGWFASDRWAGSAMGHVLPLGSALALPVRARGWGLRGARLEVMPDRETRFPLFQPVSTGPGQGGALITLRPNQDMTEALEGAAAEAGISSGRVVGLGSLVHPRLEGHADIDSFATEILLTAGRLQGGKARIEAEIVTLTGKTARGLLRPGENGICITAELLVIAD